MKLPVGRLQTNPVEVEPELAPVKKDPLVFEVTPGMQLKEVEKLMVIQALKATSDNQYAAARMVGMTPRGMLGFVKRLGIPIFKSTKKPDAKEFLAHDYKGGLTDLAKKYSVTPSTMYAWKRRLGIKTRQ